MSNPVLDAFSKSSDTKLTNVFLVLASVISVAGYLFWSQAVYKTGFPLDDAWIHQTYARNLAESGEWSFSPGIRSAGSTSPFYTILLSAGYLVELNPFFWTFMLGWLCLLGTALTGSAIFKTFEISIPKPGLWIGIILNFRVAPGLGSCIGNGNTAVRVVCFAHLELHTEKTGELVRHRFIGRKQRLAQAGWDYTPGTNYFRHLFFRN